MGKWRKKVASTGLKLLQHDGRRSSCLDGSGAIAHLLYWLSVVNLDDNINAWVAWAGDEST